MPLIQQRGKQWSYKEVPHPGDDFSDLSETYVIFMCEHDEAGNGRAVNVFSYRNDDSFPGNAEVEKTIVPHESLGGRTHIVYVNGDFKEDGSEIGKLIHDFKCRKADDMYFPNLAQRTRELKEKKEGQDSMCMVMEKERARVGKEKDLVSIMNLMDTTGWDVETAMTKLKVPDVDRPLYARSVTYAKPNRVPRHLQ